MRRFYIVSAVDEARPGAGHLGSGFRRGAGQAGAGRAAAARSDRGLSKPVLVDTVQVDVVGFAEPGASVSLLRGGALVDMATASSAIASRDFGYTGPHAFDVSADGRRLALAALGEVVDVGSGTRTKVPSMMYATQLAWSRDGRLLASESMETNQLDVYSVVENTIVMHSTLNNVRNVLSWSPDDQQLLVNGRDEQDQTGLFLVDRNGGGHRLLTAGWNFDGGVSWTPDGQHVAVVRDSRVEVLRTSDGETVFSEYRYSSSPSWSADGKRLLYDVQSNFVRLIAEYQIDGGAVRELSDASADRSHPLWTGIGDSFIYAEDGKAMLRPLDGEARQTVVAEGYSTSRVLSTGRGELFYEKDGSLIRTTLA
ncbi:hypothetical protein LP420_39845 [Massilia sp. B-10]|nr:hypothetical protein LP420_39845 [Massilia sp. B-10]